MPVVARDARARPAHQLVHVEAGGVVDRARDVADGDDPAAEPAERRGRVAADVAEALDRDARARQARCPSRAGGLPGDERDALARGLDAPDGAAELARACP